MTTQTCDGCGTASEDGPYPLTWTRMRVYRRSGASERPIYGVTLDVCGPGCAQAALEQNRPPA